MEQFKKSEVIMLLTKENGVLAVNKNNKMFVGNYSDCQNYHLYIVSDDEIKEDEPYLGDDGNIYYLVTSVNSNGKKIIATTNSEIDLPRIKQQFVDEYVSLYNEGDVVYDMLVECEKISYVEWLNRGNYPDTFNEFTLKINPKDNTINLKTVINKTFSKEQLIKAMIWAENNGKHYVGTDKEGQLEQFNEYIDKL